MFDPNEFELLQEIIKEREEAIKMENNTNGIIEQLRPSVVELAEKRGFGYVSCYNCDAVFKVTPEVVKEVFERNDCQRWCPSCGKDFAYAGRLPREWISEDECCCQPNVFNADPTKDEDTDDDTTAHAIWVGFFKPETYTPEEARELLGDNGYPIFLIVPTRDGTHEGSYEDQNKGVFDIGQKFISALLDSKEVKDGNDRVTVHFFGFEISEIFNSPGLYTLVEWCKEETGSVTIV